MFVGEKYKPFIYNFPSHFQ